jgi:biopolymer transport protein ExbD
MSGIAAGPEGGNNLNIDLNLVPFIDLLSTLTLFLLVSAVWVQISTIPAAVQNNARNPSSVTPPPDTRVTVHISKKAMDLTWPGRVTGFPKSLPLKAGTYDLESLTGILTQASTNKALTGANVSSDEDVEYGMVISLIDAVKAGGLISVALNTN